MSICNQSVIRASLLYRLCRQHALLASTSTANLSVCPLLADKRSGRAPSQRHHQRARSPRNHQSKPPVAKKERTFDQLIKPVDIRAKHVEGAVNVGEELTGRTIQPSEISSLLSKFSRQPEVRALAAEHAINDDLFMPAVKEFRTFCMESNPLPEELHIVFSDILSGAVSVDDLFSHFLAHAHRIYPHLECMTDLQVISDLREPHAWFAEARMMKRKIFFHAGPTNSGKTYNALQQMFNAKSGVYCGPLRLLASEVFHKCNDAGVPCDLVTGEERRYAIDDDHPADHVSCTVEMVNTNMAQYDVAVIDEIQMMRDADRGWAWTRALLGVCANQVHVCGEPAAISLVRRLLLPCGEDVTAVHYDRMTPLTISDKALGSLKNVRDGDCIVCFGRRQIFDTCQQVEAEGHQVAVIYGALPPSTKLAQAARFNDPDDPCKVLVATDAIGMGLNLGIKRVVFTEMRKPDGNNAKVLLTPAHARQIGGRAGRYGTHYTGGEVTTLKPEDLPILRSMFEQDAIEDQAAGLHPTVDQIEMFSYHLPHATLPTLLDLFASICAVDSDKYFMCELEDLRKKAKIVEHVQLPLKVMYTFVQSPVKLGDSYMCASFLRFARRFASGQALGADWLTIQIGGWPQSPAEDLDRLRRLESVFDITDLYLWLGQRFPDMFPDGPLVREMQGELDLLIREGIRRITDLLKQQNRVSRNRTLASIAYRHGMKPDDITDDTEGAERASTIPSTNVRGWNREIQIDLGDNVPLITRRIGAGVRPNKTKLTDNDANSIQDALLQSGKLTRWELDKLKSELGMKLKQNSNNNGHEDK